MAQNIFKGLGIALITPFKGDGSVDYESLERLLNYQINNGADFLCILATTGEVPCLTREEKDNITDLVKRVVKGRIPILKYCGGNNTALVLDEMRNSNWQGIDGILSICPYYNKPSQEGLYQHFKAIADSTELPIILYNIPGRCVINMKAETTLRIAHDCDNIVAIKEATGDIEQVKNIIAGAPEGFCVYSGDDSFTYDLMKAGGAGVISTISNVATKRMKEIVDACAAGNWDEALELNAKLLPLMEGLFATTNPILVKEALALVGFPVGGVRLPLVDATPEQSKVLEGIMREVGVL